MRDFNRGRTLPPEPLSEAEAIALLGACSRHASTGIRNAALVVVLWRAGLRCAEALALKPSDIDLDTGTVRVLHGKGDRSRSVSLGVQALAVVQPWLERRANLGLNGRQPLFCTLAGAPLRPSYVRGLLPRLARRAGIAKRVHAHGLRHSFADGLRREGIDVGIISRALGHRSLQTTLRYLDHVSPGQVLSALRTRPEPEGLI
jgi:site-specific recombinase XerD